jgi:hypothetical protein
MPTTFYTEADLPLATEDVVVTKTIDHGVEVEHKVFAGTRVPADLVDAWREQTGAPLTEAEIKQREAEEERASAHAANVADPAAAAEGDPAPARKTATRARGRNA